MTARIPCRSSSSNAANTLTKVNIRIQFLLVYGNCNRMSLISGNGCDGVQQCGPILYCQNNVVYGTNPFVVTCNHIHTFCSGFPEDHVYPVRSCTKYYILHVLTIVLFRITVGSVRLGHITMSCWKLSQIKK